MSMYEVVANSIQGLDVPDACVEDALVEIHTRIKSRLDEIEGLDPVYIERVAHITKVILNREFEKAEESMNTVLKFLLPRSLNTLYDLNLAHCRAGKAYSGACKLLNAAILGVQEEHETALFVSFFILYDDITQGKPVGLLPKRFKECNSLLEIFNEVAQSLREST